MPKTINKKYLAATAAIFTLFASAGTAFAGEPVRSVCKQSGNEMNVKIVGRLADLVEFSRAGHRLYLDALRDGRGLNCGSDVVVKPSYVVVRHGRKRDLITMYGVDRSAGRIRLVRGHLPIRDGARHRINSYQNEFVVTFGRNKDLKTRFSWNGKAWYRSPGNARGLAYAPSATQPLSTTTVVR